ncbi:MAG: hypothetical protein JOZ54_14095 [Acidobacteria bacterium]|nr:hypothetical protein [Acidobacteriota bacterium]
MSSNKKADLQRRLSAMPGGKPPADLADRIKRDIPRHFAMNPQTERDQLSRSVTFNMRVAAAVLLVISATYISVQLFSVGDTKMANNAPVPRIAMREHVEAVQDRKQDFPTAPAAEPALEVPRSLGYLSADKDAAKVAPAPAQRQTPPAQVASAEARDERKNKEEENVASGVAMIPAPPQVAEAQAAPESVREFVAPPPPPPAPAAAPPPIETRAMTQTVAVEGAAPQMAAKRRLDTSIMKSAIADELDFDQRSEVFGISIDRKAFDRVKYAIEHGEQPAGVNVEALVNYFAGPQKTRRDVSLEVEGSPAPVGAEDRRAVLRYTIDTASAVIPQGASVPPVAADAKIEVIFEPSVVASHRLIGGASEDEQAESALLKNTSVTALYEIELKDNLTPRLKVATVRLTYRSVADGKPRTINSSVYGREFARPWKTASRRHRLASLGALWGETLQGAPTGTDVARRAEELAMQEPKDAKARELAELASASSRLRTSAPTGSGR